MKVLAILLLMLASVVGCASSAPVMFLWTNPVFNSQGPGSCSAAADTAKDLNTVLVYVQKQGSSDSTLVAQIPASGRAGKADSVVVDLGEGTWFAWTAALDLTGNRSCNSNVVQKTVIVPPIAPVLKP